MVSRTMIVVLIFCIAMAALEAAVVVYLRALYYADGFTVAMKVIDEHILFVEIAREIATIIMLVCIAFLSAKKKMKRLAYFLLSFAIWDIFYYVWLKVFIDWPISIFDWDILFLIPITWLGPVIAPIICSVTMIVLSALIINSNKIYFNIYQWCLLLLGSGCILFTFIQDYLGILIDNDLVGEYAQLLNNQKFIQVASSYLPTSFNWPLFLFGESLIILVIFQLMTLRYFDFKRKLIKE